MCNLSLAHFSSMEEIPLEDVDRTSIEYKVLMAYAQRRLSVSKYEQLLEREVKGQEGSLLSREEARGITPAEQGKECQELPPDDFKHPAGRKNQKKKRSNWKCLLLPSCLKGGPKEGPRKSEVNGHSGLRRESTCLLSETHEDSAITRVAERLAELVDYSKFHSGRIEVKGLVRTVSLEEDGGQTSKIVPECCYKDDGKDEKEKVIDTIVALLRKSGDELEEKMQKDKSFCLSFWDLMSYSLFRRILNQFLEEVPVDPARDAEDHVQSTKAAYVMEVTTRLTAVDNHPMNLVLGFGSKYLKENFRPWICSQGGWEKAFGLLNQDEVE